MRILTVIILFLPILLHAQNEGNLDEWESYWNEKVEQFKDESKSPLKETDRQEFIGFGLFDYDPGLRVKAQYTELEGQEEFQMETSGIRRPLYQTVGKLEFTIGEVNEELYVYRNVNLSKDPEHKNHLFVPFTDLTNGSETYGGGRYIDLEGPLGTEVVIDFNKAYNPYCAYSDGYSCPIPPMENHLLLEIKAGVLAFKNEEGEESRE